MESRTYSTTARSIRRYQIVGLLVIIVLFGGVGGWAAYASISGAVIAAGTVTVESQAKKVQHLDGGIIAKIHVKDGDRVSAGERLVTLDDTETRANLAILTRRLAELEAELIRLKAERDEIDDLAVSPRLKQMFNDIDFESLVASQGRLFKSRRDTLRGRIRQLEQRIDQYGEQTLGLKAQIDAKTKQLDYVGQQLASLQTLEDKGLVTQPRIRSLQGQLASLEGERGKLVSDLAATRIRASEAAEQKIEIIADQRSRVLERLREVEAKIGELMEQRIAAQAKLKRIDIRAPKGGVVHAMNVNTIGGVIAPGDAVMEIVPVKDTVVITARIQSRDVDQISIDQPVKIRMSAYSQRNTPELTGRVTYVSADLEPTEADLPPQYKIKVAFDDGELARLSRKRVVPGMPVDVFVQTDQRTVLSYLVRPLSDQLMRAFREN